MTEPAGDDQYILPPIKATDRCDKRECNAQALVRVVTPSGDLDFCGHHYAIVEWSLIAVAVFVLDQRGNGPTVDVREAIEEDGKMHKPFGLHSTDLCRWCGQRLVLRRASKRGLRLNYYVCGVCDNTAADMSDWHRNSAA